jgi:ribosomal protein S21
MANKVRIRVELKKKYNDQKRNIEEMRREFKRRVSSAGIMHDYRDHEFFVSESEKNRKKRKETEKKHLMASLEQRVLGGENIKASAGLLKKVMANLNKVKKDGNKQNKNMQDD